MTNSSTPPKATSSQDAGLPGVVIAGSLLLTNLSAEQLVGLNGQSWKTNMGPIAWEVGSMFTLLVLAYYFLPKYLKMGAMTIRL